MGKNRPIKFRILELFLDGKEHWNYEIVPKIQEEYGMKSNFHRDSINFDLLELASGGMLKDVEQKVDERESTKRLPSAQVCDHRLRKSSGL